MIFNVSLGSSTNHQRMSTFAVVARGPMVLNVRVGTALPVCISATFRGAEISEPDMSWLHKRNRAGYPIVVELQVVAISKRLPLLV